MFGHCDECIYCRCVKKPLGSFHVCARNAPVQSTERSHEQATFPIVQLYDKDECLSGCGEFHPDYELIKSRAIKDAKVESEKIIEEAKNKAIENIDNANSQAYEIISEARERAIKAGESAINDATESIINHAVSYLSNAGTKSKIRNLIMKSADEDKSVVLTVPDGTHFSQLQTLRLLAWEMSRIIAEGCGFELKKVGNPDKGQLFRFKAEQKGYPIQKSLIKKGE